MTRPHIPPANEHLAQLEAVARDHGWVPTSGLPICVHTTNEKPARGGKLLYFGQSHQEVTREEALHLLGIWHEGSNA